jgi:hypothetical protein
MIRPVERRSIRIRIVVANRLGQLVDFPGWHLDNLFFAGVEVKTEELDLGGNRGVEEDWESGRGLGLGRQAEGRVLGVEDGRAFGEDIDDLLAHDEGVVVEELGDLDVVFCDGDFAIVEDFCHAEEPRLPGELQSLN